MRPTTGKQSLMLRFVHTSIEPKFLRFYGATDVLDWKCITITSLVQIEHRVVQYGSSCIGLLDFISFGTDISFPS
jgi:hypothetical protein